MTQEALGGTGGHGIDGMGASWPRSLVHRADTKVGKLFAQGQDLSISGYEESLFLKQQRLVAWSSTYPAANGCYSRARVPDGTIDLPAQSWKRVASTPSSSATQ